MRQGRLFGAIFCLLLLAAVTPGLAQHARVNVSADTGPVDRRPFGKYLEQVCTLKGALRVVSCVAPGGSVSRQLNTQTITLTQVCDPAKNDASCIPQYPLVPGQDFFVSGTTDSGQVVQQMVVSGSATPMGGTGTVHYRANAPGLVVVRATAVKTTLFDEAAAVDLLVQVVADPSDAENPCALLPPPAAAQSALLDAPTIVSLLGNPTPFVMTAQGPNVIAIYSTRQPLNDDESKLLPKFTSQITLLAGQTVASLGITPIATPFSVELAIPHARALGDLAARLNGLNYSQFTLADVGENRIRVTAAATPACKTWKGFLSDIRQMTWELISEPMNNKLFYLSSSDVATAFTTLAGSSGSSSSTASPAASTTSATPSTSGTAGNATITVTQPPGSNVQVISDTTPCVAGLAFGNSSACAPAASSASAATTSSSTPVTPAAKSPLAMASVAVATGAGTQNPPDLLVYSDANPGDDAQIQERNRVIALLDLPRPEMIINAWVMQNSSTSQRSLGAFTNLMKGVVSEYDLRFEDVVAKGWQSVKAQTLLGDYYNETFRSYIEDRFVADTAEPAKPNATAQELAQAFLDRSRANLADPIAPVTRTALGLCERGRYCLGYNNLFHPLKPSLTDLLLTIIAADKPPSVTSAAADYIQGAGPHLLGKSSCRPAPGEKDASRCRQIWQTLNLPDTMPEKDQTCAQEDFSGVMGALFLDTPHEARVQLHCFVEEVAKRMQPGTAVSAEPSGAGVARGVVADFLFNYKLSQQYPHEFSPYDLSHSADALNNALSPFIDAFNRDLASYQLFVRADVAFKAKQLNENTDDRSVKRIFGLDKPSFLNDGLITVRTISGQPTGVNTTSQSSLDASSAPQLTALLSELTAAGSAKPGLNSLVSTVLSANPAGRAAALANVLSNYQTTTAQIGRSLNLTATPRSLNTASSAEITISLNADESAAPSIFSGAAAATPLNMSRVATHDTSTRVRVDSVKLFEVSTFSAILERARGRFPLLPPFVEIPYIGTFVGIPLGTAKEFHSSTAVLSAYVMPTAADIATGLRFSPDVVVDGLNPGKCSLYAGAAGPGVKNVCLFRNALALRDLNKDPVSAFNRAITRCLMMDSLDNNCADLRLDHVPRSY